MNRDLKIRTATVRDAKVLLEIYRPYVEKTAITFEYDVPDEEEFAGRIRNVLKRYPYLLAESGGEIIGYAYVSPFKERAAYDWSVETSIYIREDCQRCGAGRALYEALERILRKMGITNLNACIAAPIVPDETLTDDSIRFHEKMGYRMVGEFRKCGSKFGKWYNMVWMEKFIGEHPDDPAPIRTFASVNAEEGGLV